MSQRNIFHDIKKDRMTFCLICLLSCLKLLLRFQVALYYEILVKLNSQLRSHDEFVPSGLQTILSLWCLCNCNVQVRARQYRNHELQRMDSHMPNQLQHQVLRNSSSVKSIAKS